MLETTKPVNVYYSQPESGYDSAAQSAESSRRNSIGFKEFVKRRRFSIVGRFTSRNSGSTDDPKKADMQDNADDDTEELSPRPLYQRRMSVPEKVFLSADYCILRPTKEPDVRYEIVAAFDKHTDPYRHYMQSLTCYDLAPVHGAVVMIDGGLMIHKALTSLIQSGQHAAVVCNLDIKGGLSMITFTDCLRAIIMASQGINEVAAQTVSEFIANNNRKQLITAETQASVWDTARMLCLNSVHRIPILQVGDEFGSPSGDKTGDVLFMLSLRTVLHETVLKLSDPKFSLGPHVKQRSLSDAKIGTWNDLFTLDEDAKCLEAVEVFLERRVSCLPVVDCNKKVLGILSKHDLMTELQKHPTNFLEVLNLPVLDVVKDRRLFLASPTMSVLDAIGLLFSSERQSVFVVNFEEHLIGVVSYADVMDYIQNSSEVHHKMSCA